MRLFGKVVCSGNGADGKIEDGSFDGGGCERVWLLHFCRHKNLKTTPCRLALESSSSDTSWLGLLKVFEG